MLFILEIIDFFRDYRTKITNVLQEESGKEIYIFPIAYGITLWSQILKAGKAGKDLGFFGLFTGMIIVGSIFGVFLYFIFPYILTWVSKIFTKTAKYKDLQKVFAWSLTPFIIGIFLTILELIIGGQRLYSGVAYGADELSFRTAIIGFISFASYIISMYFLVIFTKSLSHALKLKWWKALIIILLSAMILMFPTALLRF